MPRWATRLVSAVGIFVCIAASAFAQSPKMGPLARAAASMSTGFSPVIVRAIDRGSLPQVAALVQARGGTLGRELPIINARVAMLPNAALDALSRNAAVDSIFLDRPVIGSMERTGATVGATAVRSQSGYTGAGVGVAVIDSGITSWHDDLTGPGGAQRVSAFVDLVNNRTIAYDDYGHGTHVAGIIAGNGVDSSGKRTGIAPRASLIAIKAIDAAGSGRISDVIAAFDYVLANRNALNIRVVNVSLSSGVYESYTLDPLTVAAKRLVDAGVVVVAAAGNVGRDAQGHTLYGGITSPGNAPWVLTVGASSHMGTVDRSDDTMAPFSSRGPTALDLIAKPDLVAPGVGIESLSDPSSAFYSSKASYLLNGTIPTSYLPYLSLTGTSMAAPVVTGTVALMMEANPSLTPNEVKAILQYTSQVYTQYDRLTEGAGFLNTLGAVQLAKALSPTNPGPAPATGGWSRSLIWGTHLLRGGDLAADANAWGNDVTWGSAFTGTGANVEWGDIKVSGTTLSWGTACGDAACSMIVWSPGSTRNVVWGNACGGDDCQTAWNSSTVTSSMISNGDDGIVVWGSTTFDIVVWGSTTFDIVVWGSSDDLNVTWPPCDTCGQGSATN